MTSYTDRSHDGERPTLPPIRDLFHDLRTPYDSPSLTLARLRVSDDYDDPTSMRPTSSQDRFRPPGEQLSRSQTTFMDPGQACHKAPSLFMLEPLRTSSSPDRSFGPLSLTSTYTYEAHNTRTRHSLSFTQEPIGLPNHVLRRHSSFTAPCTSSVYLPSEEERTPVAQYTPRTYDFPSQVPRYSSTIALSRGMAAEDQRTPFAAFGSINQSVPQLSKATEDNGATVFKYECSYCGKGFNRPSSLKIHLNSHTGAKPFMCPVEGCGRSFSVLSNMRRHARVHTQTPLQTDPSSDEERERSAPPSALSHSRSSSIASVSSSGSRRSLASDDDTAHSNHARPEKRSRTHRQ